MPRRGTKTIGAIVRKARQERGLSQKELGERVKLSDKAISSYEVERAVPSLSILRKISVVTRKPISYFLDDLATDQVDLDAKLDSIARELTTIREYLAKKSG